MPIDSFTPAIQQVLVRLGFLEAGFREWMQPLQGYDRLAVLDHIEARIGESKTLTRPAILPAITVDATPTVAGSDLNKGTTAQQGTYEQFTTTAFKLKGMTVLSMEMDYTKISSEFLVNYKRLAEQAAQSLDTRAATRLFQAYDGGNTFITAAVTAGATIAVDNVNGFQSQYTYVGAMANGTPSPISTSNKLPVVIYSSTGTVKAGGTVSTLNAQAFTVDVSNGSGAVAGGVAYGSSGTITLDAVVTVVAGDVIKAVDGSFVIRPNNRGSRSSLVPTDLVQLKNFAKAAAKLRNRRVPTLPNGLYAAMIDAELLTDLLDDVAFQRATATTFGIQPYFREGIVAKAFGIEFVPTTTNPVYGLATGVVARHALVCGMECIIKSPLKGSLQSAQDAKNGRGPSDVKITDDGIVLITRAPIDVEADDVTQLWRFSGGMVCSTDITSTPLQIPTTDFARYKRAILIESASPA